LRAPNNIVLGVRIGRPIENPLTNADGELPQDCKEQTPNQTQGWATAVTDMAFGSDPLLPKESI
jgi:hypothetical protein